MPFNRNLPLPDSDILSAELRSQLTGLDDKIIVLNDKVDALPVPVPETDPVFQQSEAAQLVPGDKAKIETAVQPGTDILQLSPPTPTPGTFKFLVTDSAGGTALEFVGPESIDAGDIVYTAGNAADWSAGVPATPGAALDVLAGRSVLPAPVTPPVLGNSQLGFSVDEAGSNLLITVKFGDGTTKTATLPLV